MVDKAFSSRDGIRVLGVDINWLAIRLNQKTISAMGFWMDCGRHPEVVNVPLRHRCHDARVLFFLGPRRRHPGNSQPLAAKAACHNQFVAVAGLVGAMTFFASQHGIWSSLHNPRTVTALLGQSIAQRMGTLSWNG